MQFGKYIRIIDLVIKPNHEASCGRNSSAAAPNSKMPFLDKNLFFLENEENKDLSTVLCKKIFFYLLRRDDFKKNTTACSKTEKEQINNFCF